MRHCLIGRRSRPVVTMLFLCGAVLLLSGCGRVAYTLTGRVLDDASGQPLPGVQVSLGRRGAATSEDGQFELPLRGGTHILEASLAGYVTQPFSVTVSAESPAASTELRLVRRALHGLVVDERTGTGVPGATVALNGNQVRTAADGAFALDALAFTPLQVAAAGYFPTELPQEDVSALFGPTGVMRRELRVALAPRVLTGIVRDAATGAPLAGIPVATALGSTETGPDGAYELVYVEPGATISFGGTDYRTLTVPYAEQATQDAALEPWHLSLTVVDAATGTPMAGVVVQAGGNSAATGADGSVAFDGVVPGTPLSVAQPGYRTVSLSYAGEEALQVALERSVFQGTLRSTDGTPVSNGLVQAFSEGASEPLLVRSDADGHFVLEDAGNVVSMTVKAAGYRRLTQPVTDMLAADAALEPFQFRGVYIPFGLLQLPDRVMEILDMVETTGMTGVVVDVKGDWARIAWDSANPLAKEIEAYAPGMDLQELVNECHRRGIYIMGRIVVFKDEVLGKAKPDWAVKRVDGSLYADNEGLAWVDPFRQEVRDYNIALAVEIAQMGFDEVQLDYLRFPSDGSGILGLVYSQEANFETRTAAMAEFCAQIYDAVSRTPAFLSADIFGLTPFVDASRDMGIGQRVEDIAPSMDYLSPMAYPTTYADGTLGFPNPGLEPYQFVYRTVRALRARTTTPVRPWLQGYSIGGIEYGTFEFLEQRKAAEDAGSVGWIWWNSRGQYAPDAFYPDAIANTPGLSDPPSE